jgi:hypothetical protein
MLGGSGELQGSGFEPIRNRISIGPTEHWISFAFRTHYFDLNVGTGLFLGQFRKAQVRLNYTDVGEDLLGVLGLETGVDNDILT